VKVDTRGNKRKMSIQYCTSVEERGKTTYPHVGDCVDVVERLEGLKVLPKHTIVTRLGIEEKI
jgi:hypothetical protein